MEEAGLTLEPRAQVVLRREARGGRLTGGCHARQVKLHGIGVLPVRAEDAHNLVGEAAVLTRRHLGPKGQVDGATEDGLHTSRLEESESCDATAGSTCRTGKSDRCCLCKARVKGQRESSNTVQSTAH